MNKDYYKILGLSSKASGEEIKKAYHRLAKLYHPDINGGNLEAAEVFKEVNEAYHILFLDPNKKAAYDRHSSTGYVVQRTDFQPYFIASIDTKTVKLNEEFEITYRYLGEGRVFKKPMISSIFYNSSPVINHRIVHTDNGEVKETSMTFTISALTTGSITIPPASIYINHKLLQSEPLTVIATGNDCYFKNGEEASSHPYILYMHKEQTGKTLYRRTYIYRHAVLIPRSHYAYYYHQIGATMKVAFTILGALYFISINNSVLTGFFVGSLLGGIACNSMYKITGMRSKFYHTLQYATARTYFEEGYKPGREVGYWIFDDKAFFIFLSLFR